MDTLNFKIKQDQNNWEQQYSAGNWDCLKQPKELPRYGVLSAYIRYFSRPITLLDVGCGEGLILKFCEREYVKRYCGVDISQTALDNVKGILPQDKLVCSTLEKFFPEEKFDVILFNEILYYILDPVKHLNKFKAYLAPGGVFIISMHKKAKLFSYNNRCIRRVWKFMRHSNWKIIDEILIKNTSCQMGWKMVLVKP